MSVIPKSIVALLVLILGACATAPARRAADVSQYRTFALAPLPAQSPRSDPEAAARLGGIAHKAIVETLSGKGYKEVDPGAADFIVKLHAEFSPDGLIESSEERLLMIELLDRQNEAVLWSNQRGRSSSRSMESDIFLKTIMGMLASIPPSAAAHVP